MKRLEIEPSNYERQFPFFFLRRNTIKDPSGVPFQTPINLAWGTTGWKTQFNGSIQRNWLACDSSWLNSVSLDTQPKDRACLPFLCGRSKLPKVPYYERCPTTKKLWWLATRSTSLTNWILMRRACHNLSSCSFLKQDTNFKARYKDRGLCIWCVAVSLLKEREGGVGKGVKQAWVLYAAVLTTKTCIARLGKGNACISASEA